ncbi:PP2C family protein-serine/threonine phosphatase [bacterium]|nr:PP2C family protein-serine/threonine phosphatase [bacterium]
MKIRLYIVLAAGIIGYIVFFAVARNLPVLKPFQRSISKEAIQQIAYKKAAFLGISIEGSDANPALRKRNDLANYLKRHPAAGDSIYTEVPSFAWRFTWNDGRHSRSNDEGDIVISSDDNDSPGTFMLFDYRGFLLEFRRPAEKSEPKPDHAPEGDRDIARLFESLLDIPADLIPEISQTDNPQLTPQEREYTYTNRAGLKERLYFRFEDGELIHFYRDYTDDAAAVSSGISAGTVISLFTASIMLFIIIAGLIIFIKKAKNDELEYRRGILIGVIVWILFLLTLFSATSDWEALVFGGGIGGIFVAGGAFLLFITAESINRDVWKTKIACTDTLFQGYFFTKNVGREVLFGLGFGGIAALYYGFLLYIADKTPLLHFALSENLLEPVSGFLPLAVLVSTHLFSSIFIIFSIFFFLYPFLRYKTEKPLFFLAAAVLVTPLFIQYFPLLTQHDPLLYPAVAAFMIFTTLILLKREFLTLFMTIISFSIITGTVILVSIPDQFSNMNAYGIFILFGLLFLAALYALVKGKDAGEIEDYHPEYLVRLAEKERFMRELEIARHIQMQFLPAAQPVLAGVSIASMCNPAYEVGGDYYDFLEIDDNRLGIIIGDVSGKGVSAAFYMTLAKGIVKTAAKTIRSPRELLISMNQVFYENVPRGIFISVMYGVFDFTRRTLTFARAGHNPLILRKQNQAGSELLNPKGLAIGLEQGKIFDSVIEEQTIGISSGDVFVLYTDGITESMNRHEEEFGEETLAALVEQHSGLNAEAQLRNIQTALEQFTGSVQQFDDQTMVIIKIEE